MMHLFILIFFYAIPTCNVSDPVFSLPTDIQSGFGDVVLVPTTSQAATITLTPSNTYSDPRACVGLSSLELTPSSTIDFFVNFISINPSTLTVSWSIQSTIDVMKFSYLIWDYPDLKYPPQLLYFNGMNPYRYSHLGSIYSIYLKTGSQRSQIHAQYYSSSNRALINVMIHGIKAETLSNQYNVNITTSRLQNYYYITVSIGSDTKLDRIDVSILIWASYFFIDKIYSYQDSVAFVNDKMEGVLTDNDNSKFLSIVGWTGLSMRTSKSFKFDLASDTATDFFPNQLTNLLPYNSFNVMEFSQVSCPSDQLDTLTYKCKTIEEMYGCSTYGKAIKMPLDTDLQKIKISPGGKYLVGCKRKKVYILQYNRVNAQYSLFQEIDLMGDCRHIETSRNWSYLATVVEQRITIYGLNQTYKYLFEINDGNFTQGFSFSANATFIFAKVYKKMLFYRLNYSAGTYQQFYSLQSTENYEIGYQIKEGEIVYLKKQYSDYNLILRKQNQVYVSEDPGQKFAGMDISADETLQVAFNQDNLIIYNIDDENKRTIHQIIPNKYFWPRTEEIFKIKLSEDKLTLVFMSVANYNKRMIVAYERANDNAEFVETKHIHVIRDLDYELQQLLVSSDGEIIITSYKQNYLLFYYCLLTINDSEILPEITYNISKPVQQKSEQPDDPNDTEQPKPNNETIATDEPQKQVEGLTIFLTVIGIVNFGLLIGMAVFMIKKFTPPTQQQNHRIYDNNTTNPANNTIPANNGRVSDKSNILADFSQQQIKSVNKSEKQSRTRKKRRTQQFSVGEIESQENIGQPI